MKLWVGLAALLIGCSPRVPQSYIEAGQKACDHNGGAKIYIVDSYLTNTGVIYGKGSVECNDGAVFSGLISVGIKEFK